MTRPLLPAGAGAAALRKLYPPADRWRDDPVGWINVELDEHVWSKQQHILESVRDHRYTAVRSAHSTGKSHIASRAVAWWLASHPVQETFVVTTAPTTRQVKAILWRYIKSAHRKASLPGYITDAENPEWKIDGTLAAFGAKPQNLSNQEEAAAAFQGIHARYVLVVLDEAGGIPGWLWDAVDTLVTAPTNRVLAIGNPDDPTSRFAKVCAPDSGWNVLKIAAQDTPAFTGEPVPDELLELLTSRQWVQERADRWGTDSPLYVAKVLADFPEGDADTQLIPPAWIREAQERDLTGTMVGDQGVLSVDVARFGRDKTTIAQRRGGHFRVLHEIAGKVRTTETARQVQRWHRATSPSAPIVVDGDGIGGGVVDPLVELGLPVVEFTMNGRAMDPSRFDSRRSEVWWSVRERFQDGGYDLDPTDEVLAAQLGSLRWSLRPDGRIHVETKAEMRKRGQPSPDRADTLMMSGAVDGRDWQGRPTPPVLPSRSEMAGVMDLPM